MVWFKKKEKYVFPCKLQYCYFKVGFKGRTYFPDGSTEVKMYRQLQANITPRLIVASAAR